MTDYNNEFKTMTACCDECYTEDEFIGDFCECINGMKNEGWKIFKDGDWRHKCPECSEDNNY